MTQVIKSVQALNRECGLKRAVTTGHGALQSALEELIARGMGDTDQWEVGLVYGPVLKDGWMMEVYKGSEGPYIELSPTTRNVNGLQALRAIAEMVDVGFQPSLSRRGRAMRFKLV